MQYLPDGTCLDHDPPDWCDKCEQMCEDAEECPACDGSGCKTEPYANVWQDDSEPQKCEACDGCGHKRP